MSEFNDPNPNAECRRNPCYCGETGRLVIINTPRFSIDVNDRSWSGGGHNLGANRYFSNKYQKEEWMKRSEKVEYDPRTGKENISRIREVYPEESAVEHQWLKDAKEARADGAPLPKHPDETKRENIVKEQQREYYAARREGAMKMLGELNT